MRSSSLVVLLLALASAGCGRACKKEHPYVPYAVGDGPGPSSLDGGSVAPDGGALPVGAEARIAPAHAVTWKVDGLELIAPPGFELALALVRDLDGDGAPDALAVVRPAAPGGLDAGPGGAEVVYYAGTSSPPRASTLAAEPASRVDAACSPVMRLERVGPRSALVEVGAACPRGGASRALFVIRLERSPSVTFELSVVDPPGAARLAVDVDGADRDRDGVDDVALRVTLEGGAPPFEPGPKVAARVAFFDRSAGPSRDPDEPEASLRLIAAQAAARAASPRDAGTVPGLVQQLRMLYRAMCVEGGAPRLLERRRAPGVAAAAEGAIACLASRALEDAGIAEVRSFVTQRDALRAVAAAEVAQLSPATRTAARTAELTSLLGQVAPLVDARSARLVGVTVAAGRAAHPAWGPLAFEASGKLLVRGPGAVTRVDVESGEATDADTPVWPSQVLSPDGQSRWLEAYHACEGVALRATFAPTGADGELREVLLPVAPPLGGRCAGGRGEPAVTVPLAWGPRGLEALVAGQPLLLRPEASSSALLSSMIAQAPPLGSPRSAEGHAMALATTHGVLVLGRRAARHRAPELEPYAELEHCTTTDDGARIACVKRDGRVVAATLAPP